MALLADGLHMASHFVALGIALFAYRFARRHADDRRFSFGTGKVNALGGFTGAVLLAVFAVAMVWESVGRLREPIEIAFDQAILVACLGLAVNIVSAVILMGGHSGAGHGDAGPGDASSGPQHHHDHNLRSAYLHVVADALTSVLAIVALMLGKHFGAAWLDPMMGIVGAIVITRWSIGLLNDTGRVLLDFQAPEALCAQLRQSLEQNGDRVADLHLWSVGPGIHAASVTIVTDVPAAPAAYHARVPGSLGIVHMTTELHRCERDH